MQRLLSRSALEAYVCEYARDPCVGELIRRIQS